MRSFTDMRLHLVQLLCICTMWQRPLWPNRCIELLWKSHSPWTETLMRWLIIPPASHWYKPESSMPTFWKIKNDIPTKSPRRFHSVLMWALLLMLMRTLFSCLFQETEGVESLQNSTVQFIRRSSPRKVSKDVFWLTLTSISQLVSSSAKWKQIKTEKVHSSLFYSLM